MRLLSLLGTERLVYDYAYWHKEHKEHLLQDNLPEIAYHIQTLLDGILDKRDIDDTLKEIEGDILEDDK